MLELFNFQAYINRGDILIKMNKTKEAIEVNRIESFSTLFILFSMFF